MSLKKQALNGTFWMFMNTFGTQGISFAVSIILARLLMPSEFGLIAMLGVLMALGTAIINGGLTQSLIRSQNPDEEDFSTVFYFNLLGSIIIYGVVFFVAPLIAVFFNQEILVLIIRIYFIIFIINAFSAIQITRLTKKMDFKTQFKVSIPSLLISSFVGLTMAYYGYGVWSLVWSAIFQSFASSVQLWFWSKWRPLKIFKKDKFKYHFNYGLKLMFSGILDTLFNNLYTIIIGKFFAPTQVGFYNRANSLQMFPVNSVSSVIAKVTFPLFASIQDDNIRLKGVYKRVMQMVLFFVAPILIFMAVLAEPLFRFLFTEKWLPSVPYFQILCLNGILFPIHSYNLQILNVKGRSDLFLKLEVFKKVLLILIIIVSFKFGIFGLLYGSALSSILSFFINSNYAGKFINYSTWEQIIDLLPVLLLSLSIGLFVYLIDIFIINDLNDFIRLLIGSLLGIILYFYFSFLFKMKVFFELKNIIFNK